MNPSDLVLAAALLTALPGTPEQPPPADRWPAIQAAIHQTAIEWEILDPRETRYVLARIEDYQGDLDILRKRQLELADAPRVIDSCRFPDRDTVNEFIRFNRAYRKHLEVRQAWESDRADLIRIVIMETDRLYKVWDAVRDARCDFYYITFRRQALLRLQELIGPEAYAIGELPPYVPEWRFSTAK